MHEVQFQHLDSLFRIFSSHRLDGLSVLLDGYQCIDWREPRNRFEVRVRVGSAPVRSSATWYEPLHRSPDLPFWNLTAELSHLDEGRRVEAKVLGLGIHCTIMLRESGNYLATITLEPVFRRHLQLQVLHLICRNLALHTRVLPRLELHASGVSTKRGVVAFAGAAGFGKTTAMLQALRLSGVSPFSNGRLFVEESGRCESWPSYLSVREGSVLSFPWLERVDQACRSSPEDFPWLPQRPPELIFNRGKKRAYPLDEVAKQLGKKYHYTGRLASVIFPLLGRDDTCPLVLRAVPPADLGALFAKVIEGGQEKCFLPWHGFASPSSKQGKVVDWTLSLQGTTGYPKISAYTLEGSPRRGDEIMRVLEQVLG